MLNNQFFEILRYYIHANQSNPYLNFLTHIDVLKSALNKINCHKIDSYLYNHFIFWLSRYMQETKTQQKLQLYFTSEVNLNFMCTNFIDYCFRHHIKMDSIKTHLSFKVHNQLSDHAVKKELSTLACKQRINLLGFGLDDGVYEKELANFLILKTICNEVTVYGIDPYARKGSDILYLTPNQLSTCAIKFDIIIARWSLHHVSLENRWSTLSACIHLCNPDALIIFIEHGFLQKKCFPAEKKLYELLNAFFDIIANIGLRPNYFTQTAPYFGEHFFIHYLEPKDLRAIFKNFSSRIASQNTYDVGPRFPNQTIFCLRTIKS